MQIIRHLSALGVVTLIAASVGGAELTRLESLAPVRGCGCAIDPATGEIFVTSCNSIVIEVYSSEGERLRSYWQPTSGGLAQEHVDLDFVSHPIELGGAAIPGGSLLLINGNDLAAEVYALDPFDGTVHGTLSTAFGDGRVSGGAYHPSRGTIFLLQNRFAPTLGDTIAEIDPATGAVLNHFPLVEDYTVWYIGDIDVSAVNGNLFVVSSWEETVDEYTPDGTFVQRYELPFGVPPVASISMIDGTGEAWTTGTLGGATRLGGFPGSPCDCEMTGDGPGAVDVFDLLAYLDLWFSVDAAAERTGDLPANIDVFDLLDYLDCWFAGC